MDDVIEINAAGVVTALHNDDFPLDFLGPMEVHRQTDIRYCNAVWNIHYITNPTAKKPAYWTNRCVQGFPSYNTARNFEVRWLSQCRLEGVDPCSTRGQRIAKEQRGGGDA